MSILNTDNEQNLLNQIDALRAELAQVKGENERLKKEVAVAVGAHLADVELDVGYTALRARVAEQDEQIAALQAKVHLCAAYDALAKRVAELERIRCPNTHIHRWDGDGMCKHCGNYATDLIDAALAGKENTREED